jgi:hypothetical protein
MPITQSQLAAMAEIGAMRNIMIQALALRLLDEEAPLHAVDMLGRMVSAVPTQPPAGEVTGLDPAVSDMLAALTDERTAALVAELRNRVELMAG